MTTTLQLSATTDYATSLVKRLEKEGITHAEVVAEMQISKTQFSRWVTANPARRVEPRMSNVRQIEEAIKSIQRKRARRKAS